jgi:hypothetical protein
MLLLELGGGLDKLQDGGVRHLVERRQEGRKDRIFMVELGGRVGYQVFEEVARGRAHVVPDPGLTIPAVPVQIFLDVPKTARPRGLCRSPLGSPRKELRNLTVERPL